MTHYHTKEYGMIAGLRCVYRTHQAEDATRFLHGHSLGFVFTLCSKDKTKLDNYCEHSIDWIDQYLEEAFNYTTILAADDPKISAVLISESEDVCDIRLMESVGIQHFSSMIRKDFDEVLKGQTNGELWIGSITVVEHGSNKRSIA